MESDGSSPSALPFRLRGEFQLFPTPTTPYTTITYPQEEVRQFLVRQEFDKKTTTKNIPDCSSDGRGSSPQKQPNLNNSAFSYCFIWTGLKQSTHNGRLNFPNMWKENMKSKTSQVEISLDLVNRDVLKTECLRVSY